MRLAPFLFGYEVGRAILAGAPASHRGCVETNRGDGGRAAREDVDALYIDEGGEA